MARLTDIELENKVFLFPCSGGGGVERGHVYFVADQKERETAWMSLGEARERFAGKKVILKEELEVLCQECLT